MNKKSGSQQLNLKKLKPYGDTMNDGRVQLSFTLPVPCTDEAIEVAKQLMRKMGLKNPQVVFIKNSHRALLSLTVMAKAPTQLTTQLYMCLKCRQR